MRLVQNFNPTKWKILFLPLMCDQQQQHKYHSYQTSKEKRKENKSQQQKDEPAYSGPSSQFQQLFPPF